jgi:hypothetical protein
VIVFSQIASAFSTGIKDKSNVLSIRIESAPSKLIVFAHCNKKFESFPLLLVS